MILLQIKINLLAIFIRFFFSKGIIIHKKVHKSIITVGMINDSIIIVSIVLFICYYYYYIISKSSVSVGVTTRPQQHCYAKVTVVFSYTPAL